MHSEPDSDSLCSQDQRQGFFTQVISVGLMMRIKPLYRMRLYYLPEAISDLPRWDRKEAERREERPRQDKP